MGLVFEILLPKKKATRISIFRIRIPYLHILPIIWTKTENVILTPLGQQKSKKPNQIILFLFSKT